MAIITLKPFDTTSITKALLEANSFWDDHSQKELARRITRFQQPKVIEFFSGAGGFTDRFLEIIQNAEGTSYTSSPFWDLSDLELIVVREMVKVTMNRMKKVLSNLSEGEKESIKSFFEWKYEQLRKMNCHASRILLKRNNEQHKLKVQKNKFMNYAKDLMHRGVQIFVSPVISNLINLVSVIVRVIQLVHKKTRKSAMKISRMRRLIFIALF